MRRTDRNPRCPVNVALEAVVGDPWSLLVIRDIVFHGKHTFAEFLASDERVTTSVLSNRLATLVRSGILTKTTSKDDRRRERYALTEKGLALIPILVEMANWGVSFGPAVTANELWVQAAEADTTALAALITTTVKAGGSVWNGPGSVVEQLRAAQ